MGTTIKFLRRTLSAAAGSGLGITVKYLRGAVSIGLGTTIKPCDAQRAPQMPS